MLKKVLATFGHGGATVEVLPSVPEIAPGETVQGGVLLLGGQTEQELGSLSIDLVAEVHMAENSTLAPAAHPTVTLPFTQIELGNRRMIAPGESVMVPFELSIPWETPITISRTGYLSGMAVGIRAEADLLRTIVDAVAIAPIVVTPLPSQQRILDAMTNIGFTPKAADLEYTSLRGVDQQLPFIQEIEYEPPTEFAEHVHDVELTFIANATDLQVVLEVDKRVRVIKSEDSSARGETTMGDFSLSHDDFDTVDWEDRLQSWLTNVARTPAILG
ncbi:sporulation-control protein [Actinoalloteichus hoggarensis]|uniref:Sporulation-control protein spo0M n=1 Tax=Actinoalloteichus hoggarensis TaxID=1470176 RepID=A0A221W0C5_9PSEU|nr:sporulation protein [Actinoalloteichus hoggarensis]ASO19214.1 Sporulation-control protein spo0M [Actinoalloteichus hoggarensis]MBB5920451.1 sporulation-control protein [Actinoalloteichus hoggarensis]